MDVLNVVIDALYDEEEEEDLLLMSLCKKNEKTKNMFLSRETEGCFQLLITRHLMDDDTKFQEYFRLTKHEFFGVHDIVSENLRTVPSSFVRRPISSCEKLALTLRYLATGESLRSLSFQFRISHNHVGRIVKSVLCVLAEKLLPLYLPAPTEYDLKAVANEFFEKWNFPNCCGAIDGKHVHIVCPKNTGSLYFNYESYFSIVLLAIVAAKYKFIYVDVEAYGKEGDSGIFQRSSVYQHIHKTLPKERILPGTGIVAPHVIIGDEAFQLTQSVLRSYPRDQARVDIEKRIFNYRICRARRTSENAFGILCQTFRIYYAPIAIDPIWIDKIILVTCSLHNLLRSSRTLSLFSDPTDIRMPEENMINLQHVLMLVAIARKRRYRTRIRRYGVRPFNKLRKLHGQYETMVKYIKTNDEKEFFSYTRMTPAMFDHLLMLVEPKVRKHPSRKNALCPSFRLCLTLHYLAEGCSMKEISRNYYIGKATAHVIIREICTVLWDVLKDIYIPEPTIERMVEVSKGFYRRWNMPNCLGALDGKHVSIQAPYHSGSEYFSYKKSFSLVLMAACDSYYKFIYVDIAAPGSLHDSYIFRQSNFGRAFLSNEFEDRLPQAKVLPNSNIVLPYFLVADQSLPVA
ncbi:hypothetical protein PPYR_00010 [Photinus pyralis]|uniref:DDE Tnp4 domain-containing protein n=1 Tax=Photinus pyralis TaxID=7054 RepID=A0A5N4B0V4_PHOPY|nr:hypothetical protein PPYR_00010 [Photinus pyralis]